MAHMTPTPVLDPSEDKTMILNMGPQHPSTHGVLRLLLEIDGETIVRIMPDIGYLHTGIEKTCEAKFYQQVVPMTDRIDYLCPMTNNLAYCLAVEKLLGLEIPPRAQWLRVLLNELTRINSHLVWLGTHAMDIGAMTVFLYCFREREDVLRLFEAVSGQRMMTSYFRIGGVALEPPLGWFDRVKKFLDRFPGNIDEYENLLTNNPIWVNRTKGVAYLAAEDAIALCATGPTLRGQRRRCRSPSRPTVQRLRELQVQRPHLERWRCLCAIPGAGSRVARVAEDCQAGVGRNAGRPGQGGRAQGCAARSREDEDADGSAHLSLQDRDRRIYGARGRSLHADRVAARRDGLLRGERWHGQAISRAHALAIVRESAVAAQDVRRPPDRRRSRRHRQHRHRAGRLR